MVRASAAFLIWQAPTSTIDDLSGSRSHAEPHWRACIWGDWAVRRGVAPPGDEQSPPPAAARRGATGAGRRQNPNVSAISWPWPLMTRDKKSDGEGQCVLVSVDHGGRRLLKK